MKEEKNVCKNKTNFHRETKLENEEKMFCFYLKNKIMKTTFKVERVFKRGSVKRFKHYRKN